jgi:site-specific DNA recombinase
LKVAIYIRVSTDEQANEGFSIEAQKRRLLSYADSQDWQVVEIYLDDGYSAKDLERPAMKEMIKAVKLKLFDVVLVYKLDRMTRSTIDCDYLLKLLERNEVKFQSATESFETRTATGRLFIRLVADIAQWERENTAERVRFGMEQMVIEGKRPGGKLPYGYDKEGNIVPEEADLIRKIRSDFMNGMGYKSLAMQLNRSGKFRRGKEWSQSTVAYTLENPFYAGIIRFGSKKPDGTYANHKRDEKVKCIYSEGAHEKIISKEEYDEHVDFMKRKSNGGFSQIKDYWFSGVLRCGRCGSAMFGRLTTKRSKKDGEIVRTQYYICSKKHDGRSCDMPVFRQIHIEKLLKDYIDQTKLDQSLISEKAEKIIEEKEKATKEVDWVNTELARIRARRKKWQYMFAEELMTAKELKLCLDEDAAEENKLQTKLNEIESQSNETQNFDQLTEFMAFWEGLSISLCKLFY